MTTAADVTIGKLRASMNALAQLTFERTSIGLTVSLDELKAIARDLPEGYALASCNAVAASASIANGQALGGYFVDQQGNVTGLAGLAGAISFGASTPIAIESQFFVVKGGVADFTRASLSAETSIGIGGVGFAIPSGNLFNGGFDWRTAASATLAVAALDGALATD